MRLKVDDAAWNAFLGLHLGEVLVWEIPLDP